MEVAGVNMKQSLIKCMSLSLARVAGGSLSIVLHPVDEHGRLVSDPINYTFADNDPITLWALLQSEDATLWADTDSIPASLADFVVSTSAIMNYVRNTHYSTQDSPYLVASTAMAQVEAIASGRLSELP